MTETKIRSKVINVCQNSITSVRVENSERAWITSVSLRRNANFTGDVSLFMDGRIMLVMTQCRVEMEVDEELEIDRKIDFTCSGFGIVYVIIKYHCTCYTRITIQREEIVKERRITIKRRKAVSFIAPNPKRHNSSWSNGLKSYSERVSECQAAQVIYPSSYLFPERPAKFTALKEDENFSQNNNLQEQGQLQFEEKWPAMRPTVLKLLHQEPVSRNEWQDWFWSVHSVCLWDEKGATKVHQALHEDILVFIHDVQTGVLPHEEDLVLLKAYIAEWSKFFMLCDYLPKPFGQLEATLAGKGHQSIQKKNQTEERIVQKLMLDSWNQIIFSNIKFRLQDSAMKLVHAERNSEAFDSQLMIGVQASYVNLSSDCVDKLKIYRDIFEQAYLEATEAFYKAKAPEYLTSNGVQEYMQYADAKLKEEEQWAMKYLETRRDCKSVEVLVTCCLNVLVTVFMRHHKAYLTWRLILDSSADNKKEENMVEWLREVGMPADYLNKLAQMFQDIKVSEDLNQKKIKDAHRNNKGLADSISIKILNAGAWARSSDCMTVTLPMELEDYIPQVEEFYRQKHSGRKVQWHHLMSDGIEAIVKILKMRKHKSNAALQTKIIHILKMFAPSKKMIKEQIEWLIEHKYMRRDDINRNHFSYVA